MTQGRGNHEERAAVNDALLVMIESLLAMPPECQVTAQEVSELVATAINQFRGKQPDLWNRFLKEAKSSLTDLEVVEKTIDPYSPSTKADRAHKEVQSSLIEIRHATAMSIAAEKQLEQKIRSNREQSEVWKDRELLAQRQGNDELVEKVRERLVDYSRAADELATELEQQRFATAALRRRLDDAERAAQKVHIKKEMVVTREEAARTLLKANELISSFDLETALSQISDAEADVAKLEHEARASFPDAPAVDAEFDLAATMQTLTAALRRAVSLMDQLEAKLQER